MPLRFGGSMRGDGKEKDAVPLTRNLAVVTQLHLPGTAGRLAQQIRDLEAAALISLRQSYELADAAMTDGTRRDLIILDTPLLLSRSMVAPREDAAHHGHRAAYEAALARVERFWSDYRDAVYPWREDGPVVVS